MTVHTTTNKVQYTGNGSARVWPYPFPCADEDWLKLYVTEGGTTARVLNDYAVDLDEKTVTYPVSGTALTSTQTLTILRELPLEQSLDLVNQGTLEAEAIEAELDEIVQMLQQLEEQLKRTVMAGVNENAPSIDYDALHAAGVLAQEMGTRAQNAASSASAAALAAQQAASAANTAAAGANTAKASANAAAAAAQRVADAVDDYTERAENAAQSAEAEAVKAYSNAQRAHEYFCKTYGVIWPFIQWFMRVPILDGKCSRVFSKQPPALIADGGDIETLTTPAVRIYDGMHSDPLEWVVVNPIVTQTIEAVSQIKALLTASDTAQSALESTITAANEAVARAQAAIGQAMDYIAQMDELATATGEIASQACACSRKSCRAATRATAAVEEISTVSDNVALLLEALTGGQPGQVLARTADGYEWVDLS